MIISVAQGIEFLNKIWKFSQNIDLSIIQETQKILSSIVVNEDSIQQICKYSQNLKRTKFEIILFQSPFIYVYIEDLLIKSIHLQQTDPSESINNFIKIKDITIKSKHINLQLKDLINYYYFLIVNKNSTITDILQQINDRFDKIIGELKILPYQINPIYKMQDLFQQEECVKENYYNTAYHILKQNVVQGLRMAANSLINSGLFHINQFQTRLVNIYSNVRPISFDIGKYDFKILLEVQLTSDLFDSLKTIDPHDVEKQQKQFLKEKSLIVVVFILSQQTNLQIFAYFEILQAVWSKDLMHPAIEVKPLDIQSINNLARMLNTKNQNIVLESKSQHYMNYKYLSYLIEQTGKPILQKQIKYYMDDLLEYGIKEITRTNDSKIQIRQISKMMNNRLNIVYSTPSSDEFQLVEELIKTGRDDINKQKKQFNKFLIICQNNDVQKNFSKITHAIEIKEDFNEKSDDFNEIQQKEHSKKDYEDNQICKKLFNNMIIPNYEITALEIKMLCFDLYSKIIQHYAIMNTLIEEKICDKCQNKIVELWILNEKKHQVDLDCKCYTIRIVSNTQHMNKWQNFKTNQTQNKILQDKKRRLQLPIIQRNRNISKILELEDIEEENEDDFNIGSTKQINRILKIKRKLQNLSDFEKEYQSYKQNYISFNHGIEYDEKSVGILLNDDHFLWGLDQIDRNYLLAYIYSRRYLQNLSLFQYYYDKIHDIQLENKQQKVWDQEKKYFNQNCNILVSNMLNMSNNLGLIEQIGDHTLIIIGANRFAQGHLHSYIRQNTERIILIGDENQIDNNLFIENLNDSYQINSHFKIITELIEDNSQKIYLSIQTKATKEIYKLLQNFYPNLEDQNNKKNDRPARGIQKNIQFFSHEWKESINFNLYTIWNEEEAKFVAQLARYLILSGNNQQNIFIVTFTHQQKILIKKFLKKHQLNIEVGTPLAFDGKYRKIVIVSMVRSNKDYQLGALKNVNKIISAFSRSQNCLFVIGNLHMIEDALQKIQESQNNLNKELIDRYSDMMDYIQLKGIIQKYFLIFKSGPQPSEIKTTQQLTQINSSMDKDDKGQNEGDDGSDNDNERNEKPSGSQSRRLKSIGSYRKDKVQSPKRRRNRRPRAK